VIVVIVVVVVSYTADTAVTKMAKRGVSTNCVSSSAKASLLQARQEQHASAQHGHVAAER
jgi:hypothetical protein